MSLGRNQVTLVGMLGDNVNITQFENGGMVARFRLDVKQDDDSVAKNHDYRSIPCLRGEERRRLCISIARRAAN